MHLRRMVLSFCGIGVNSKRRQTSGLPEGLCRRFSLAEIGKATNDFDVALFIAEGEFADVYKGYINIDDGAMAVVIKRWSSKRTAVGERVLKADVLLLCQLRHPHILSLVGFCDDCGEMMGVYDYMSKGTLLDHLIGKDPLSWKKRLQICVGVARGLHYLHTGTKRAIVHRDVKPHNILLDDNWVPKVSNLGISKMASLSMSNAGLIRMEYGVAGTTIGYYDPECLTSGYLTEKSDVYSFGVVLLQILSGRLPTPEREDDDYYPFERAKEYRKQITQNGIDPYLKGKIASECFNKFVEIAQSCVRDCGIQRPAMGEVEASLEFALELQENADTAIVSNNAGAEYCYPDCVFPAFTTVDTVQDYNSSEIF